MKILGFEIKREKRFGLSDLDNAMDMLLAGRSTATGVNVNPTTAMGCVAYLAGVRLISETVRQ